MLRGGPPCILSKSYKIRILKSVKNDFKSISNQSIYNIYIYIYIYICIYIYIFIFILIHKHKFIYIKNNIYIYIYYIQKCKLYIETKENIERYRQI